jgi:YYY domain-containing protein
MEYALVVLWWLAAIALGLLGLPLSARLFPRLAGRGVGFALPVALVVLGTVVYWLGHVAYGLPTILAGVAVLLLLAALAGLDRDALRDGEIEIAPDLAYDLDFRVLGVFTAAFLFVIAIRAVDPGAIPAGGEKFLDFGLLNALDRADGLPPEDFWFAGEAVSYYYGGHLVVHNVSELTGTPPEFAYNLGLALFYATFVTAAYDLAGAVADARGHSRTAAGLLGAFFVGFASNLATFGRSLLSSLPEPLRTNAAETVAARAGELTTQQILVGVGDFNYWTASRIIPGTINEFPLFGWLNGDLHAHMMGPTFLLLAAAVGFSYYRTPTRKVTRRRLLAFGVIPLLGGLQAVIHTWSFPTVFGLLWLAVLFAPSDPLSLFPAGVATRVRNAVGVARRDPEGPTDPEELASDGGAFGGVTGEPATDGSRTALVGSPGRVELTRVGGALVVAGVAGLLGFLLAAPFLLSATGGGERAIDLWPAVDRSSFGALLIVHGAFLAGFFAFLLARLDPERPILLAVGLLALLGLGALATFPALGLVGPVLLLGWVALRFREDVGYETVLMIGGAGLVLAVEVVYLNEQAGPGRMNTVFKTYSQVWALWAVALGTALASLLPSLAELRESLGEGVDLRGVRQVAAVGFVALLVVSTSIYGGLALSGHFSVGGEPTLDATAYIDDRHPEEATAIRWLDRNAEGTPTMVSAPGAYTAPAGGGQAEPGMYTWNANPAASMTGVPTVAGWAHEVGYRGQAAYDSRVRDADLIYQGDAETRVRLLSEYDVQYVWVGPAERLRYGEVRPFGELAGVEVTHQSGSVTIYRVDQSALSG